MIIQNKCKVSVILPVYNVAPFLRQCLDSIAGQTLKDIEIICVDDGSSDDSPAILSEYAERDERFVVISQANAGAGAARNRGIREACGKYLSFLDADDFFALDMLQKAYDRCEKSKADFIVFRSDIFNNESGEFEPSLWTVKDDLLPTKKVFSYQDMPRDIFKAFVGWAWDKLYLREFVMDHQLLFQEQRTTNDMLFVFSALVKARRIIVCQDILAHHRRSLTEALSVTREKSWDCFYQALTALKAELLSMGIYETVKPSFVNYALHFSLWNINTITGPAREKLYNCLRDEYFTTLGITDQPADFFYHKGEYAQYLKIMSTPFRADEPTLEGQKSRVGIARRFIRACRSYGLRNAIRTGTRKVLDKVRRKKS